LELISKLRPVTYEWKEDGQSDVGFIAEEVNAAEPLLSVYNSAGKVEGVKYAQITTALVNSVKEQQAQIDAQTAENQKLQEQIKQQQAELDALKAIICAANPGAGVCRPKQ
jgi:Tfp pilus assembly protein FimV